MCKYMYKDIKELEKFLGYPVNESVRMGFDLARLPELTQASVAQLEEQSADNR